MTAREEELAASREAAALKAEAKAKRDATILRLAAEGDTVAEIAKRLGISGAAVVRVTGEACARRPGHRGLPHGVPAA